MFRCFKMHLSDELQSPDSAVKIEAVKRLDDIGGRLQLSRNSPSDLTLLCELAGLHITDSANPNKIGDLIHEIRKSCGVVLTSRGFEAQQKDLASSYLRHVDSYFGLIYPTNPLAKAPEHHP